MFKFDSDSGTVSLGGVAYDLNDDINVSLEKNCTNTSKSYVLQDFIDIDKYYYPKFLIKPTKKQGWNVLEYEIHYQYVFGQDWNILYDVRKRYSENDIELQELNKNGYFSIYYELEKVPVETVYDPSSYYGVLNYNSIDVLNCYIRVRKQK